MKGIAEWEDAGCYYYAMEYCEGELFDFITKTHSAPTFRSFVTQQSHKAQVPMSTPNTWVRSVAGMFGQICEAVQWMHERGYCHLDLSLENTMISDRNTLRVKIIDLGLTQHFADGDFRNQKRVGKQAYMAPEVC